MVRLRFPLLWWGLGWLLVAGVILGSLVPGNLVPLRAIDDKLLHAGSYAILTLWFSGLVARNLPLLAVALLMFVLGASLDVMQGAFTRRMFDLEDIAANTVGIIAAFVIARLLLAGWCARVEKFFPA